ncbi:MAG TPA: WD40 repeat domain-containing protein, partial [Polyangiaceae bacterium]|nr:WD40 repeat domain-containing protein [Polyangiaceae bacterium]
MLQGPRRAVSLEQNPFRGLLPFTQRHAEFFYGREEETAAFVERMRMQPVLPVVGPSGAGKSSFVHAGVIPRVREQDLWIILRVRPGTRPFQALAARLAHRDSRTITVGVDPVRSSADGWEDAPRSSLAPQASEVETLIERLRAAPRRLSLELRDLADYRGAKVLLVVDQLEELFTLVDDPDERARFMEAVCTAADDPADPVRVVFTVRDDFLGRLVTGPEVRDALAQVTLIQPLGPNELEQVLERPSEALGYRFESGLVAEMVGEVSREASGLPLLQFAAHRLWEERDTERRLILHSAYRAMGGVAGALAQHADGVVDGFDEDELRIARELCLRLVTPERTRKIVPKSEALEGLDASAAEAVLAQLIAARLVSARRAPIADATRDGDVVRLELVHESLIEKWRTLERWLEESQEGLAFLAEAGQAAQLWHKRGRRPEEVWQGVALEDALRKLAQCRTEVPERVRDFLSAGQARRERHARRRRLFVAGVMGLSVLVAATALAIAFYVAHKEREALADKDRALAERAEALLESAREALAQRHVLEARAKLRDALTVQDSQAGRALWWQLSAEPLVWSRELGTLTYDAAFTSDGRLMAVASHDKNVHLFDAVTGATRMLRGHTDQVWSVAAGGATMVSGSWNGELAFWDVARGELTRLIRAHGDAITHLDVSSDGAVVASASSDHKAALWDVATGKQIRVLPHPTEVGSVAMSADASVVATGAPDGRVRLWRGAESRELGGHDDAVLALDMSADGRLLASASADNTVRLWRTDSGK